MKRLCSVYKSPKTAEMYVYVDRKTGVEALPEALLTRFGEPALVMDLILTEDKKLARADAAEVLESIESQGFYLQMPPENELEDYVIKSAPRDSLNG